MSLDVCFYFQVHQPWRLRRYAFAEVGHRHDYFDEAENARILRRVAEKCYRPMNRLLLDAIARHRPHLRLAFSISATALQQMAAYAPAALASFRRLFATGQVELLAETSHHSLAALYSPREFAAQVRHHRAVCRRLLGAPGPVFRNTELIVSDAVAAQVAGLGYAGMCLEGADGLFAERSVLSPYRYAAAPILAALPRHYRLSDDIAFRFSDRQWSVWPLCAERFADWVRGEADALPSSADGRGVLGLFMDYETFGEHQWADTGIFEFMDALPGELLRRGIGFVTPTQAAARTPNNAPRLAIPTPLSWADSERDTSAWDGNPIQRALLAESFALEPYVRRHHARHGVDAVRVLEGWRRMQTSDHAYYLSTKHWADGDVHRYFSPFDSPYEACINAMNVLADLAARVGAPAPRAG